MLHPDAGPSSLVFFADCLKIISDSYLQIQNYKNEAQLKPKLHQLWRIALCFGNYKLQLNVFLKTVWVFWPERVVPPLGNSLWTVLLLPRCDQIACYLRADRKADINQTCQQSLFSPIGACIRIWCTAGAVNGCRKCLSTGLFAFPSPLL